MPENPRNYADWTPEDLRKAEATASQFLAENGEEIGETLRTKARFLDVLIGRISAPVTTFDDRLEYLARISEIAELIREECDGFFELASQPTVARILGTVSRR